MLVTSKPDVMALCCPLGPPPPLPPPSIETWDFPGLVCGVLSHERFLGGSPATPAPPSSESPRTPTIVALWLCMGSLSDYHLA